MQKGMRSFLQALSDHALGRGTPLAKHQIFREADLAGLKNGAVLEVEEMRRGVD